MSTSASGTHRSTTAPARRFMNLLGAPNWISGVALCAGNTAAINRMVYGWFPFPDFAQHAAASCCSATTPSSTLDADLQRHPTRAGSAARSSSSSTRAGARAPSAPTSGCRCGPAPTRRCASAGSRSSSTRASTTGTSSRSGRVGFDELRAAGRRVPARAGRGHHRRRRRADRPAARMYATTDGGRHPVDADHRPAASTAPRPSACTAILRARHRQPRRARRRGAARVQPGHRARVRPRAARRPAPRRRRPSSWAPTPTPPSPTAAPRRWPTPTERVWGRRYANIVDGLLHGQPVGRRSAPWPHGDPYPVKAFFALGNNTLIELSPNMQLIHRAMMSQELVVVARAVPDADRAAGRLRAARRQLAGAQPHRRRMGLDPDSSAVGEGRRAARRVPRASTTSGASWPMRMGFAEHFPWATVEEVLDHRLAPLGPDLRRVRREPP